MLSKKGFICNRYKYIVLEKVGGKMAAEKTAPIGVRDTTIDYTSWALIDQQRHAERVLEDYREAGSAKPVICAGVIVRYTGPTLEQVRSAVVVVRDERLLEWLSDPKTAVGRSEAVPEEIRELAASRLSLKLRN